MKPIHKGLAVIAVATAMTVFAINFFDKKESNKTENVANPEQGQKALKTEAAGNNVEKTTASEGKNAETDATINASNNEKAEVSPKVVASETDPVEMEVAGTQPSSETPAPPGPYHKNMSDGQGNALSSQEPVAPTMTAEIPPPPMPQAVFEKPAEVANKPEAPSMPVFEAQKKEEFVEIQAPTPEVTVATESPTPASSDVEVKSNQASVETKEVVVEVKKDTIEKKTSENTSTKDGISSSAAIGMEAPKAPEPKATVAIEMPAAPAAPEMPQAIQQYQQSLGAVDAAGAQPKVIFVPVPVYPSQPPAMMQAPQWNMNMMPPPAALQPPQMVQPSDEATPAGTAQEK